MSKAIKDKMDKLDPLSGGIVFAKEEGWERLQGKLEQKPARKISLGYTVAAAAAAILLMIVCINALYNKTEDTIAAAPALYQYESTRTTPSMPAAKEKAAGIVSNETKEVPTMKRGAHAVTKTAPHVTTPVPALEVAIEAPKTSVIDPASPAPATIVAPALRKELRVVHVNEIDNDEPQRPLYASAKAAAKEIKVVTPQDDLDREQEAIVQRNNRPHGTSPFFTLPGRNNVSTYQSQPAASNPFSIKLSIQN